MNETLRRSLKEWRRERGWSQARLAEKVREQRDATISKTTIASIETGATKNPHGDTIRRLARAFDIDVAQLKRGPRPQDKSSRVPQEGQATVGSDDTSQTADLERRQYLRMPERPQAWERPDPTLTPAARQYIASLIDESLTPQRLQTVLFVALVNHLVHLSSEMDSRPHDYAARVFGLRHSLHQVIEDAIQVSKIVSLSENLGGTNSSLAYHWHRDTSADEIREMRRAVERWEQAYGLTLALWTGVGPWWDPDFRNNLFDMIRGIDAFPEVVPPQPQKKGARS